VGLLGLLRLSDVDRRLALTLLVVALPFVAVGVSLTVQRLRATALPMSVVVFFFVPWVNLLLFVVLAVTPNWREPPRAPEPGDPHVAPLRRAIEGRRSAAARRDLSAAIAILVSGAASALLVLVGVTLLQEYGVGLFVGTPFLHGLLAAVAYGWSAPRRFGECVGVAMLALVATALAILLGAMEGIVFIAMALPIAAVLAFLGAVVGHAIQKQMRPRRQLGALCLAPIVVSPLLMTAESASGPTPEVREVRTEIAGEGAGAVRRCVFTTGTFVEPITAWDAPRRLRFDVTDQPEPMREWSPYSIHPPHLDGFLASRQGEFRLVALPDGRTRLEGSTWYTNRMWPAPYWALWSDALIQAIHRRVLEHIGELAVRDATR